MPFDKGALFVIQTYEFALGVGSAVLNTSEVGILMCDVRKGLLLVIIK